MITWKNYVGCHIEAKEVVFPILSDRANYITDYHGIITRVTDGLVEIENNDVSKMDHLFIPAQLESVKITKKVEDLTLKEWQLWAENWMEKQLVSISIDPETAKRWFKLRNRDGSTMELCFGAGEEINMLEVHKESLE